MHKPTPPIFLSAVAGVFLLGTVTGSEPATPPAVDPPSPALAEAAIRGVYQRLEDLVVASGYDLEIEVSDVRTYRAEELGPVRVSDLVTLLDCGPVLQLLPLTMVSPFLGDPRSHVAPEWKARSSCPEDEEIEGWRRMTFREAGELAASRGEPGWSSVTSAAVRVAFEGKQRRYRSMINWSVRGGIGEILPRDNVIQNLVNALAAEGKVTLFREMIELHGWQGLPDEPDYISSEETYHRLRQAAVAPPEGP